MASDKGPASHSPDDSASVAHTPHGHSEATDHDAELVDLLPLAVVCFDDAGGVGYVNAAWRALTGPSPSAQRADDWLAIFDTADRAAVAAWVSAGVIERHGVTRDVRVQTGWGERLLRLQGEPHFDRAGRLRSYVLCGTDVTEQVAREDRLAYAATHDQLTGLVNRAELVRRASMLACDSSRTGGGVALLLLHLADLAVIHETGGRNVGDAVLRTSANRLRATVRPFDVVARYGEDELAVLLVDVTAPDAARAIAGRALDRLAEPTEVRGERWVVQASVGIAITHASSAGDLLDRADASLEAAKAVGAGEIEIHRIRPQPSRTAEPVWAPGDPGHHLTSESPGGRTFHAVHFYDDDADLLPAVAGYVGAGLFEDCVTVVATADHRRALNARLGAGWVDAARAEGRYLEFDADETLARIMRDGLPDRDLFQAVLGTPIRRLLATHARVRGYGEMVGLLLADGQLAASLALEDLWNEVHEELVFPMLCAYARNSFAPGGDDGFRQICSRHTQLLLAG